MLSSVDIIALRSIPGIGDQTIRRILRTGLHIKDLSHLTDAEIKKVFRSVGDYDNLRNNFTKALEGAEYEIEKLSQVSVKIIGYNDDHYPYNLASIDDFPILLYCLGNIDLLKSNKNVAVIGTRENSSVGGKIAQGTSGYFAKDGFTIVSGLALGIDTIAHESALKEDGNTIAVLVDIKSIYPKQNSNLAVRIVDRNGLLISENKPGSFQSKSAFVLRDRIQSGLSLAIFPIETDIKGGTMHTVEFAQKQRRLIYVPDIYNTALIEKYDKEAGKNFPKLNGIRYLVEKGIASTYTRDDYDRIRLKIESILQSQNESLEVSDTFEIGLNASVGASPDKPISEKVEEPSNDYLGGEEKMIITENQNETAAVAMDSDTIEKTTIQELAITSLLMSFKGKIESILDLPPDKIDTERILKQTEKFYKDVKKILSPKKKANNTNTSLEKSNKSIFS